MSEAKNVVFSGDVTLVLPDSTDEFGFGDLTVERKAYINGTADATNSTDASLIVAGGIGVTKSILADLDLTIDGHSQLDQVTIDTTDS